MKELSVIMPVYNEESSWLNQSIQSILNQTYTNFEFIIILDNPKNLKLENQILEFVKKDSRIRYYKNERNIGLVGTLNRGLQLCKGKYIARMDADDISFENRFEKQIKFLENNPDIKLLGTNWKCIDEKGELLFNHGKVPTNYEFIKNNIKYNNMFLHPSWMFKSEILSVIKGYRELTFCEDFDFITRALTSNIKISNINEYLILYRVRSSSISISKAYEQYVNTTKAINYMKERCKTGSDSFGKNINDKINVDDKKRYLKATELFLSSRESLKEKNRIQFAFKFLKSFFISKYRAKKNINIIMFNLKLSLNRD